MKSRALTHIVFGILFMIHTFNASSQARQLNLPVKELSVLINHTMGLHFFDFANEYRIQETHRSYTHRIQKKTRAIS